MFKRLKLLFIFLLCLSNFTFVFAEDVSDYIREISDHFKDYELESDFVVALVYPELVRYNQNRDLLEAAIDRLIFSVTDEINGCSIGPMQMKPGFAINIEKLVEESRELSKKYSLLAFPPASSLTIRIDRIARLKDIEWQCLYLKAFIEICLQKYQLKQKDRLYQLEILAAAYNAGINYSIEELQSLRSLDYVKKSKGYYLNKR